jgi:hypothetical protein
LIGARAHYARAVANYVSAWLPLVVLRFALFSELAFAFVYVVAPFAAEFFVFGVEVRSTSPGGRPARERSDQCWPALLRFVSWCLVF